MIELENNRRALYQWELNQRVQIDGFKPGTRVEFSARNDCKNSSLPVSSYEENGHVYAPVPNILLQAAGYIRVYVSPSAGDTQKPQEKDIRVIRRERPEDYVYAETQTISIEDKMDKYWGEEYKGMALVVDENGYVSPGKSGKITFEHDGQGNVTMKLPNGMTLSHDGAGNVTIT